MDSKVDGLVEDVNDLKVDVNEVKEDVKDLNTIVNAMKRIPSDLNASPANSADAARRMLATLQPNLPFNLAKDSEEVMQSILEEDQLSKERVEV